MQMQSAIPAKKLSGLYSMKGAVCFAIAKPLAQGDDYMHYLLIWRATIISGPIISSMP